MSRLEALTGTKGWPFIPVGGSNQDKRPAQPFVPVGGSNRDQRVPFYPGEDLQPGQIASPRTSSHPSILFNSHPPLSYLISSSPSPRGFPSLSILKLPASHPSPPSPGRVRPGAARRAARRASRRGWPGAATLRLGTQVAVVGQAPPPSVRHAGRHKAATTCAGPFQVPTNSMRSRIEINFFLLQPRLLLHKLNFISAEQVLRDVRGTVHQEGPAAQVPAAGRRVAAGLRPGGCVSWPAGSSSLGSASVDARTGPAAANPGGEKLQIR